jgi:hypothetical protein
MSADELAAVFLPRLCAQQDLLGEELVGVEEHHGASIEHHRPPPGRVGSGRRNGGPDVDGLRRHLAEILNDDGSAFIVIFSADETTDGGRETGTTVSPDYTAHTSKFSGKINWVQIDLSEDAADADHAAEVFRET